MRLFDLVKEHHRIGLSSDLFGKLSRIVVAHVSGRRSDDSGHRVLFHKLGHIQADERFGRVEKLIGKGLDKLCLTHARGSCKDEGHRLFLIGNACAASLDGSDHRIYRLILPHDLLLDARTQSVDLFIFQLGDAGSGDARPHLDHPRQLLGGEDHLLLLFSECVKALLCGKLMLLVFGKRLVFFRRCLLVFGLPSLDLLLCLDQRRQLLLGLGKLL